MTDAIHEGKLTLQIHNARTSDEGQYRCLFGKDGVYQEARVDVQVMGKDTRWIFWLLQLPNTVARWFLGDFSDTQNILRAHSFSSLY